ncbi:MAG TPA: hypothetical protein VNT79_02975 [Phycisphaerae bacterium]|nr:hypothetical protein [Phycisphaerae bacterium]
MSFLSQLFFENPVRLAIFSFLLFGIVLFWRRSIESAALRRWSIPGVLGLIILMFLAQMLVVTQREQVQQRMEEFVAAIVNEDASLAATYVSPAYQSEDLDFDGFVGSLRDWFDLIDVRDPRFARRDVTVEGDRATMTLAASATIRIRKEAGQMHYGVWTIEWRREDDTWRMISVQPVSIDMQPITSLRMLRGAAGR